MEDKTSSNPFQDCWNRMPKFIGRTVYVIKTENLIDILGKMFPTLETKLILFELDVPITEYINIALLLDNAIVYAEKHNSEFLEELKQVKETIKNNPQDGEWKTFYTPALEEMQ